MRTRQDSHENKTRVDRRWSEQGRYQALAKFGNSVHRYNSYSVANLVPHGSPRTPMHWLCILHPDFLHTPILCLAFTTPPWLPSHIDFARTDLVPRIRYSTLHFLCAPTSHLVFATSCPTLCTNFACCWACTSRFPSALPPSASPRWNADYVTGRENMNEILNKVWTLNPIKHTKHYNKQYNWCARLGFQPSIGCGNLSTYYVGSSNLYRCKGGVWYGSSHHVWPSSSRSRLLHCSLW
jgi:hypothetical protein